MSKKTNTTTNATELPTKQLVSYKEQLATMSTKSEKIRFLDSKGYTRSDIKNELGIIYQHVRNVLEMPVKNPKVTK